MLEDRQTHSPGVRLSAWRGLGLRCKNWKQTLSVRWSLAWPACALLGGGLGLWELGVFWTQTPHYILPAPSEIALAFMQRKELLLYHAAITLAETIGGGVLGVFVGALLALVMFSFRPLDVALSPLLVASQNVPVFAIAPLLVVWFGYGFASKVVMAAVIVFFPITRCTLDGLRSTDADWVRLFRTMGATQPQLLWKLHVPAALPAIFSGLKLAAAYATIGAVIGEWVGSGAGLGYYMLAANAQLRIAEVFAAILCLVPIGMGLVCFVHGLELRALPWKRLNREAAAGGTLMKP